MALFRKFFYRKPPEGLLEISERVYVFDCCFTTNKMEGNDYEAYIERVVDQLREYFPDAAFMVFSFGDGDQHNQIKSVLSKYDITLIDYPSHYENCPLLTVEMIHHFLRSSESWLCIGQRNVILMHCRNGAFPILAFMLAAFLIYRKQYVGEKRTLDMVYKQSSLELLHMLSSLNPLPSQLRYLQYVSRRNIGSRWPPFDRALTLDYINLRVIPNMDGKGGCRPIFRIYGPDPLMASDRKAKMLFSMPRKSKAVGYFKQADCALVKIDINCHVQGDVVLECTTLDDNLEREQMMFRVMFNTAFIRSNVLMLNREEIDTLWNVKDQFPNDFRAEVLFSDMDSSSSLTALDFTAIEDIEGLPMEAFAKVRDMFNDPDSCDSERENALNMIQEITVSSIIEEKDELTSFSSDRTKTSQGVFQEESSKSESAKSKTGYEAQKGMLPSASKESGVLGPSPTFIEKPKLEASENETSTSPAKQGETPVASSKPSLDLEQIGKKIESNELHVSVQRPAQSKIISPPSSASYSSSPQASPAALSRYRGGPSAIGITALLHDSEFGTKEASRPSGLESTVSASAPHNNSSVSPPEKHHSGEHDVNSKPGSEAPPPVSLSTPQPQMPQPSPSSPASVLPQTPPPPVKFKYELCISEPFTSPSKQPASTSPQTSIEPPPSQSWLPSTAPSAPPPPPPPPPPPLQSNLNLSLTPSSPSSAPVPSPITAPPGPPKTLSATPPPPPPPPISETAKPPALSSVPSPPPPPPSPNVSIATPPPPPLPSSNVSIATPPPPPPPPPSSNVSVATPPPPPSRCTVPSPPCPPGPRSHQGVPPPPAPLLNASPRSGNAYFKLHSSTGSLLDEKGKLQLRANSRIQQSKKSSLKPYHWLKLTRAMQGSLWAEAQKPEEASQAPELDMTELESLFSANVPNSGGPGGQTKRGASGLKSDKVHLIELRRSYNCEIMLTKVKIPLSDLMNSVLALDDSALDIDQVDNLIKFCPTKEEIELLKNYKGDYESLGKCEQFFLELIKVPRVESKLRVFSFKIQFCSQVSDLRNSLHVVNSTSEEVRNSVKLKRIMQTILQLGNALNHGTARGSAVGFRLDSLPKLAETRARNNKLTLIHYLCKVLAEKLPDVLDFYEDLQSLEAATKIQLKYLAEEMQAITKGLEKVVQELTASENDGSVSQHFCQTLKQFLNSAEAEVRSLASLYSGVGRNADALALYFGEDPARCPFEQVVSTLLNFVRMFKRAHEENCKQLEFEKKKKAQEEAENAKVKPNTSSKESENESTMATATKTPELQSQL